MYSTVSFSMNSIILGANKDDTAPPDAERRWLSSLTAIRYRHPFLTSCSVFSAASPCECHFSTEMQMDNP